MVHAGRAAALDAQGPGPELSFRDHHLALLQLRATQPAQTAKEFRPTDSLLDGLSHPVRSGREPSRRTCRRAGAHHLCPDAARDAHAPRHYTAGLRLGHRRAVG